MAITGKAWRCTVCGYVHRGDEPPDICPVCGATSDLFELFEEPVSTTKSQEVANRWRCLNCEYVHDGTSPPNECPVCGSPTDRFEPLNKAVASGARSRGTSPVHVVIAGAGIAGVSAAEAVRQTMPGARITLISKEDGLPYYRLNLTRYLAGEIDASSLPLHPEEWYATNTIELLCGQELCSIDSKASTISLRSGDTLAYDRLVMAIGSHPFVPPIPGANRENVTVLRTLSDADRILENCSVAADVVVIGGGLLGLETAGAIARRGPSVTLVEGHGWLLPRQLNETAGLALEQYVARSGITLFKHARTKEIAGDERVREVVFEDGRRVAAQLVVIATGVRSNSYVARLAGLSVNAGIVVDNSLKSSNPSIFAAGDVAEHHGVAYGTWGPSQFQGTIAGINAAGGESQFAGIPRSNMLKVLGYDMFSIGHVTVEDAAYRAVEAAGEDAYFQFVFRDSHIVGAILLGRTELSAKVKVVVEKQVDCSALDHTSDGKRVIDFLEQQ